MKNLTFYPRLILRTPLEAFSPEIDRAAVGTYLKNNAEFREALYLASPRLLAAAESSPELPEKVLLPLTRYIIRSRFRPTPFGLFSGVGTVQWGHRTRLILKEKAARKTRLDMEYLCALASELERDRSLRKHLIYYANSSLYFHGDHIRYVERAGMPVLSSIKNDRYIGVVLKKVDGGASFPTLLAALRAEGAGKAESAAFLHELADSQLIVSELEPALGCIDFAERISEVLLRAGRPEARAFRYIREKLFQLDMPGVNSVNAYRQIAELSRSLGVIPDESRLFHTVRLQECREEANMLGKGYQEDIRRVIRKLWLFARDGTSPAMTDFISRFYARYEDEEIPLLTALDTESGIGYRANVSEDFTPLTEGLTLPADKEGASSLKWKELQQTLFKSLQKAQQDGAYEIALPFPDDPSAMPELGPSFGVMFRLAGKQKLLIESIGGSSGTNLAGRFGAASEEIAELVRELSKAEAENNPGVIFAEIIHLPESRTGNILCRPSFRDFEIPYLAQSGLPAENQIFLRDLYISLRNQRVVLRHRKLNRIVVPRLGTAHNFKSHSLPVYRFLCDLQTHGFQSGLDFSWGEIAREFVFLPRVADGRIIISPATWQLSPGHLAPLQEPHLTPDCFEKWRKKYRIPMSFVLAEGDNELFIDSSNPLLLRVFLDSVKKKSRIILKEFIGNGSGPARNGAGKAMVTQFITFLIRSKAVYDEPEEKRPEFSVRRSFSLGSEWVYLKFYCGAKSADLVLLNGIAQAVKEAEARKWIDRWFFVRYLDPESHLRVRFRLRDTAFLQHLLRSVEGHIRPFEKTGLVWKIQADTYRRELERYGHLSIDPVEQLFCIDSRMYLAFLRQTDGDERENLKWLWGLKNIDGLLEAAGMNTEQKKALVKEMRDRFAEEFRMDRNLKSQIDFRYRSFRKKMEEILNHSQKGPVPFQKKQIQNAWHQVSASAKAPETLNRILTSCIHMMVNRLISSGQRLHELLMYDFLCRHYTSRAAINKTKKNLST